MSRDGSGNYTRVPGSAYTNGTIADGAELDAEINDIATALTQSLAKDGQTVPTANLPMGGFKHTNVNGASARNEYARASQVQDGTFTYLSSVSGADTITASAPIGLSAYAAGQEFGFIAAGANTGAVTLNINGIGAKDVTKRGSTALIAGDFAAGEFVVVRYDGTRFQARGVIPNTASETAEGVVELATTQETIEGASDRVATPAAIRAAGWTTGMVASFALSSAPSGWVKANGGTIGNAASGATTRANADTQSLFYALWSDFSNSILPIQDSSGAASSRGASAADDYSANKRLPVFDLRAEFVRGVDDSRGVDSGRVIGSSQSGAIESHSHVMGTQIGYAGGPVSGAGYSGTSNGAGQTSTSVGGAETRPRNVAFLYCIKL